MLNINAYSLLMFICRFFYGLYLLTPSSTWASIRYMKILAAPNTYAGLGLRVFVLNNKRIEFFTGLTYSFFYIILSIRFIKNRKFNGLHTIIKYINKLLKSIELNKRRFL